MNLICSNIFPIFIGDENELKIYTDFFNDLFEKYLPKIAYHFNKMQITPELYLIPWFEELFTKTFSVNLLYRIFDIFLLNGEFILFSVGLSIIKAFEDVNKVKVNYRIAERRPGDIATCYADASKANKELGWHTTKDIKDMCRDAYNYVKKNSK